MTDEELDSLKRLLKRHDDAMKEVWLEKQLLRNLIIDSGWMPERQLDAAIEHGKALPANREHVAENFASSDRLLAEIGLADWLADFERKHPRSG
jgi:hypothetical protein